MTDKAVGISWSLDQSFKKNIHFRINLPSHQLYKLVNANKTVLWYTWPQILSHRYHVHHKSVDGWSITAEYDVRMEFYQPSQFVGCLKLHSPVTSLQISHDNFHLFLGIPQRFKILLGKIIALRQFRLNSFSGCKLNLLRIDKFIPSFLV